MSLPFVGPDRHGFYLVLIHNTTYIHNPALYLETVYYVFVPSKTHARQVLLTVIYHYCLFTLLYNLGNYRVFKFQVNFLKVVQLGDPWTNLPKFFFSGFIKIVNFCQVTQKKDFFSIMATLIAEY